MATIDNLEQAADDFLAGANTEETSQTGVQLATNDDGVTAFTSETNDVDMSGTGSNNAVLTGNEDLNVTANDSDNVVVGNSGSNEISTGDGDDQVSAGAGDDTINITGTGEKTIDGGEGNDLFVLGDAAAGSQSTFTGLNVGDKVRVTVADTNGDGKLDVDDIEGISSDDSGNVVFTLKDGTSFTLEGVGEASAGNGDIAYEINDNGDGTFDVVLSAAEG